MDPRIEQLQLHTRRHFLRQCQVGVGTLALSRPCWPRSRRPPRAAIDNPLAPKQPHFAAKAKRVIYLHLTGSPPHLDLYDYKPAAGQADRPAVPRRVHQGQAVRLHLGRAQAAGHAAQVRPVWPGGRLAFRRAAKPANRGRRPVRDQVDDHRPVQPRAGRTVGADRLGPIGPALDGLLGDVRPGLGERKSARLRGADFQRRAAQRRQEFVRRRFSAVGLSGRAMPLEGRSGAVCLGPGRHGPPGAPRDARCPARSERDAGQGTGPSRNADPHRPVRAGLPHADGCAGSHGHHPRVERNARLRTAPSPAAPALPTIACSPGGWSSKACGSCNFSTGAGTSTAPDPAKASRTA